MSNTPALLAAEHVSMTFGSTLALRPTTFHLHPGEAIALMGPNGSGKTTALRLSLGELRPTTGTVTYRGEPAGRMRTHLRTEAVGLLGTYPFYRDLTVLEHLRLIRESWGPQRVPTEPDAVAQAFMLEPVARQFPGELSSGQAQMFALACACYRPAALLVIDEPEQNLDPLRRTAVATYLSELREQGTALLLATHTNQMAEGVGCGILRMETAAP